MVTPTTIVPGHVRRRVLVYASTSSVAHDSSRHVDTVDTRPNAGRVRRPLGSKRVANAVLDFGRVVAASGAHPSTPPRAVACAEPWQHGASARRLGHLGAAVDSKAYHGQGRFRGYARGVFGRRDGRVPRDGRNCGRVQRWARGTGHVATYQD